jgi:hypothetical protein
VKLPPTKKTSDANIVGEIMEKRAKFIPLRLKLEERKYLRLYGLPINIFSFFKLSFFFYFIFLID